MIKLLDNTETAQFKYMIDFFESTINSLSMDNVVFKDDILRMIIERTEEILNKFKIEYTYLNEEDTVSKDYYNTIINKLYTISSMNMENIPDCYNKINIAANDIIRKSEELSTLISKVETKMSKTESIILNSKTMNSIKNELIEYCDFTEDVSSIENTLFIDKDAGCLILNNKGSNEVNYKVKSITINKNKGIIKEVQYGDHTDKMVVNGYFHGRTYSLDPDIDNDSLKDVDNINDKDIDTSYSVEYNGKSSNEDLVMLMTLVPESEIDYINIQCDYGDNISVESKKGYQVYINNLYSQHNKEIEYIDDHLLSNEIMIDNSSIGKEKNISILNEGSMYPSISSYLHFSDIDSMTIELKNNMPQKIWYPEKTIFDKYGKQTHSYSYYETLLLNKYNAKEDCLDPYQYFTDDDLSKMNDMLENSSYSVDTKKSKERYLVSVREVTLHKHTFLNSGTIVTNNLFSGKGFVASIELYTNEFVPEGTEILYSISFNRNTWINIVPVNVNKHGNKRIVLDNLTQKDGDYKYKNQENTVYLKIDMSGGNYTPVLKSYALKFKVS